MEAKYDESLSNLIKSMLEENPNHRYNFIEIDRFLSSIDALKQKRVKDVLLPG